MNFNNSDELIKQKIKDLHSNKYKINEILNDLSIELLPIDLLINSLGSVFSGFLAFEINSMITTIISILGLINYCLDNSSITNISTNEFINEIKETINNDNDNIEILKNEIKDLINSINNFKQHQQSTESNNSLYDLVNSISLNFIKSISNILKESSTVSSCIYTIITHCHLLFLNEIILNSNIYNINENQERIFYKSFTDLKKEYNEKIINENVKIENQLSERIIKLKSKSKLKGYQEWNIRNKHYNFMKLYVFDICNYWYYIDPYNYSKGFDIYNLDIILSNIQGSIYNGDNHSTYEEIELLIKSKNIHSYNGEFKSFSFINKSYEFTRLNEGITFGNGETIMIPNIKVCDINYPTYISSSIGSNLSIYSCGKNNSKNHKITNIEINEPIEKIKVYNPIEKIELFHPIQKSFTGKPSLPNPIEFRDFQFGLDINGNRIGNFQEMGSTILNYPFKVLNFILPTTYNKCNPGGHNEIPTLFGINRKSKIKMVEGVIIGFISDNSNSENVILEKRLTIIDAQKYIIKDTSIAHPFERHLLGPYENGIILLPNCELNYKISFNQIESSLSSNFKFQIYFKPLLPINENVSLEFYYQSKIFATFIANNFASLHPQHLEIGIIYNH